MSKSGLNDPSNFPQFLQILRAQDQPENPWTGLGGKICTEVTSMQDEISAQMNMMNGQTHEKINKFPAHYDHCVASKKVLGGMLERAGFSKYDIYPFWGHGYYNNIPVLRNLGNLVTRVAKKAEINVMASYVYVFAYK